MRQGFCYQAIKNLYDEIAAGVLLCLPQRLGYSEGEASMRSLWPKCAKFGQSDPTALHDQNCFLEPVKISR